MALAGQGVVYCLEDRIQTWTESGELQVVFPEWAPVGPAFHIYYPSARQPPPGLRELVAVLREGMEELQRRALAVEGTNDRRSRTSRSHVENQKQLFA